MHIRQGGIDSNSLGHHIGNHALHLYHINSNKITVGSVVGVAPSGKVSLFFFFLLMPLVLLCFSSPFPG